MTRPPRRWLRTSGSRLSVLLGIVVAMALTAGGSPVPSPSDTLHSGAEGAKAALVRIELRAVAEIAHIDHTTGEVEISRGRSTVPLGYGTGVLTSADGIVATTWENLAVDDGTVAVHAANELFADVIGVPVVGNDGNPSQRGFTPNAYWRPHLQHCYDQVTHCVLFRVPQYHVRTYTSEPGGVMAELLNDPSEPHDVALLRISGGGGAPTAALAPPDAAPGEDTVLLGFTERPTPENGPVAVPVTVDEATGRISSPEDMTAPLEAGVSGGPVLDRATGEVLGLSGAQQDDGSVPFVPAAAIQAAMEEAGVTAEESRFDAVFRRGVDHLSSGNPGGSAESALEESLTYYDSALATSHLERARALGGGQATDAPASAAGDTDGPVPAALLPVLVGLLLLAGIVGALVLRRRGAFTTAAAGRGARVRSVAGLLPAKRSGTGHDRSARTTAAREDRQPGTGQQVGPRRTGAARTEAARQHDPASRQAASAPSAPAADPQADARRGPGRDETRAAGPLAPRAADAATPAFCSACGRPVRPGARFCSGCGHPVG